VPSDEGSDCASEFAGVAQTNSEATIADIMPPWFLFLMPTHRDAGVPGRLPPAVDPEVRRAANSP
jgi:hypothetical protein